MSFYNNFHYKLILIFSIFLIFNSCAPQNEEMINLILLNKGESDGITWRVLTEKAEYYYTDRIPVILELKKLPGTEVVTGTDVMEQGAVLGDFRLYDFRQTGLNRYKLILQPLKSGPSVFRTAETLGFNAQFEMQINSRLDNSDASKGVQDGESTDPMPLILKEQGGNTLTVIIAALLLLIAVSGLFFLIFKKRKNRESDSGEETLDVLLKEAPSESDIKQDENRGLEFYRKAYILLLKDLNTKHRAVKVSDSPLELMTHLETPSALNQWALRSLYPMLEDWEYCFFSPPADVNVSANYKTNLGILRSWLEFQNTENKESGI